MNMTEEDMRRALFGSGGSGIGSVVQHALPLERWLDVRLKRGWEVSGSDDFRGLRPSSKLIISHKGEAFELAFKHRMLDSGPEVYRCCDTLQQTFSRLYRQAGIKGGSSHSGRRTLAAKVLAATGDVEMWRWSRCSSAMLVSVTRSRISR